MRKILFAALLLAVSATAGLAQGTEYKRGELGFGYSLNHADTDGTFSPTTANDDRENFHGFYVNGGYNFHRYAGVQAEFSHHRKTTDFTLAGVPATLKGRINQGLFGVKFQDNATETKVRPFARFLAGVGNGQGELRSSVSNVDDDDTGFAAAVGGGVAFRLNNTVDLTTSADYNPIRLGDSTNTETNHNFRFGVGLTIRFGNN